MPNTSFEILKQRQSAIAPESVKTLSSFDALKERQKLISETPKKEEPEKSTLRKIGDFFTSSTQKFGKTIGEAMNAPKAADMYAESVDKQIESQRQLLEQRKRIKASGGDTSKLDVLLKSQAKQTSKVEDFTGDVINKTTGQVIGEGIGTGLEALSGGLLSSGAKTVASKTLSTLGKVKEGAKIGGVFGAIGGGSGAMQEGGGVGDTIASTALGGALGAGLGGGLGYAGAKAGQYLAGGAKRAATLAEKNIDKSKKLTGEILQGTPDDIMRGQKVLSNPKLAEAKTYQEGTKVLDEEIKALSNKQDAYLDQDKTTRKLKDLGTSLKVGEKEIRHNFVNDALEQLDSFFTKTNNPIEKAKIAQLRAKATKQGLTTREVNGIAKLHGEKLNAFNASGELASGLTKQAAENTRTGLKTTVRKNFGGKVSQAIDKDISDTIRVRDLFNDMAQKVNTLQQRIQERSLGAKAGYLVGKVINTIGLGSPKGIVESLIPRGQGFKVMNALDLEKALQKNIKILQEIGDKSIPEATLIQKLESFFKGKLPDSPSQYSFSKDLSPAQRNIPPKINQNIPKTLPLSPVKSRPKGTLAREIGRRNKQAGFSKLGLTLGGAGVLGGGTAIGNMSQSTPQTLNKTPSIPEPKNPVVRGVELPVNLRPKLEATLYGELRNIPIGKEQNIRDEATYILNTLVNRVAKHNSNKANSFRTTLEGELSEPNQYKAFGGNQFNQYSSGNIENKEKAKIVKEIVDLFYKGILPDNSASSTEYHHEGAESKRKFFGGSSQKGKGESKFN